MAIYIANLGEIQKFTTGSIVFGREQDIWGSRTDRYDIGMVTSRSADERTISMMMHSFDGAMYAAYKSEVMEHIRSHAGKYAGGWDKTGPSKWEIKAAIKSKSREGRMPPGKGLIVATMPVPNDEDLASLFAGKLEDLIDAAKY